MHIAKGSWIIVRNYLDSDTKLGGGKAIPAEHVLKAYKNHPDTQYFMLYDDDDNLYYDGYILEDEDSDYDSLFDPLDWATYNAGCTYIKYRNQKTGKMEIL
jgi:hypothetical protein